jgi:hypothetical protein
VSGRSQAAGSRDLLGVLRLWVAGWSEEDLADMLGVHPARMPAILKTARAEVRARTRKLAEFAIEPELECLNSELRKAVLILIERCSACGGDEQARLCCEDCEWTGYRHGAKKRLRALKRISSLANRRIRLLGLNKLPPKPASDSRRAAEWRTPAGRLLAERLEQELSLLKASTASAVVISRPGKHGS